MSYESDTIEIGAICSRHSGALTGPSGEREFQANAFRDVEDLLEVLDSVACVIAEKDDRIDELETRCDERDSTIEDLEKEVAKLRSQIDGLESEREHLRDRVEELREDVTGAIAS